MIRSLKKRIALPDSSGISRLRCHLPRPRADLFNDFINEINENITTPSVIRVIKDGLTNDINAEIRQGLKDGTYTWD